MKKPSTHSLEDMSHVFDTTGEKHLGPKELHQSWCIGALEHLLEELDAEGLKIEDNKGNTPDKYLRNPTELHITYTDKKEKKKVELYFGKKGDVRMWDGQEDLPLDSIDPVIKLFKRIDSEHKREKKETLFQKSKKNKILNLKLKTIQSKAKILSQEMGFEYCLYDASEETERNPKTGKYQKRKPMVLSVKLDKQNCLDIPIPLDDFQSVLNKLEEMIREVTLLYKQKHSFQVLPHDCKDQVMKWGKGE